MRQTLITLPKAILFVLLSSCGQKPAQMVAPGTLLQEPASAGMSDLAMVRDADYSILFIGNSHTSFHDLPNLVGRMIKFRSPDKKVYVHVIGVGFLEDAARNPSCLKELEERPWKHVVLQAQKISMSGRKEYSRAEGIDLAKRAKARGAAVLFFSEWGLKGVAGDGAKQEKVYQEMATGSGSKVAPVGRAWDLALAERPEMPLHESDGNHQTELGAFLTACVLYSHLTGESPSTLAGFKHERVTELDRKFLIDAAVRSFAAIQ